MAVALGTCTGAVFAGGRRGLGGVVAGPLGGARPISRRYANLLSGAVDGLDVHSFFCRQAFPDVECQNHIPKKKNKTLEDLNSNLTRFSNLTKRHSICPHVLHQQNLELVQLVGVLVLAVAALGELLERLRPWDLATYEAWEAKALLLVLT